MPARLPLSPSQLHPSLIRTSDKRTMRLGGSPFLSIWIIVLLSGLFLLMVSCGAPSCSWERATDTRGLNRHRASCHLYRKSSALATQKRQEHAKGAAALHARLSHCHGDLPANSSHVSTCDNYSYEQLMQPSTSDNDPSETNCSPQVISTEAKAGFYHPARPRYLQSCRLPTLPRPRISTKRC